MKKIKISKKVSILLAVLLVIVAAGGVFAWRNITKDNAPSDVSIAGKGAAQDQTGASFKSEEETNKTSSDNKNAETPNAQTAIRGATLNIDSFSQSNGVVRASATVTSSSAGSCYFGFSSSETKPVSRSLPSTQAGSVQKCSVEINEVEFTKLGTWTMNVIFTQNDSKVEKSQNVTIN